MTHLMILMVCPSTSPSPFLTFFVHPSHNFIDDHRRTLCTIMLAMSISDDDMRLTKRIFYLLLYILFFFFLLQFFSLSFFNFQFSVFVVFFFLTLTDGHKRAAILDYEELVDQCIVPTHNLYASLPSPLFSPLFLLAYQSSPLLTP